jgi:hypothetical protein
MKVACARHSSLATHLARPFRIMFTASIPCNVRHAVTSEPSPLASYVRFFTVRWSCSTTLLRHCTDVVGPDEAICLRLSALPRPVERLGSYPR